MGEQAQKEHELVEVPATARGRAPGRIRIVIAVAVAAVLILGAALAWHAEAKTNKVALVSSPKPVTTLAARGEPFRAVHTYVGALRPWVEAKIGPQFISAYVETVLVRPGAVVTKGQVLATLDCRNATAQTSAISSKAKAIASRQRAISDQAVRTRSLLDGGFVSTNESELIAAKSDSEAAEFAAEQATLSKSALDVNDCILRAPFDGEVSLRLVDPGSFVRPSSDMLGIVDRNTIRMTADAPESDFDSIPPGAKVTVHVVSLNLDIPATIARRAPSADLGTRTVHFEIDIDNSNRRIPVDTTGEIHVPVGEPVPATAVPIKAVTMNDKKATLFTVEGDVAHVRTLEELGEAGSDVFFAPDAVKPGTLIVIEGRALLKDGDRVAAKAVPAGAAPASSASNVEGQKEGAK
jgi:membrane fusion protein (multidrug efflux system)